MSTNLEEYGGTELVPGAEPKDLMLLTEASEKYGIDTTTLVHRSEHAKGDLRIVLYRRVVGNRARVYVSEAAMKTQPKPKSYAPRKPKPPMGIAKQQEEKTPSDKTKKKEEDLAAFDERLAIERHTAYAFGRIEAWLDIYADSCGIPKALLAGRVGELLRTSQGGRILGNND